MNARKVTRVVAGAGMCAALLIGAVRDAAAAPVPVRLTAGTSACWAYAGHHQAAPLGPVVDLLPLPYRPQLPLVGPLVEPTEPVTSGPDCPASARTSSEQSSAAATADPVSGRWSTQLDAQAGRFDAGSSSGIRLSATFENPAAGNLRVLFDEVTGAFSTACDRCTGYPQSGYMTYIVVKSSAGTASVGCGTSASQGAESAYSLPDDRCGLDEHGNPAVLPVSAGQVGVDIAIEPFVTISGPGATGPESASRAALDASARLAGFDVDEGALGTTPPPGAAAGDVAPPEPATSDAVSVDASREPTLTDAARDAAASRAPVVATTRADELPRAGTTAPSLAAVGGLAVLCGTALLLTAGLLDRRYRMRRRPLR